MPTTTSPRPTEPLRAEHRDLWPHLRALPALAAGLADWDAGLPARLRDAVAFLRGHLVPHAQAEEAVLYPAYERVTGAPGATATMVSDHREIVRRIEELERFAADAGPAAPGAARVEELRAALYGLDAILALHFAKEEEDLLPALDEHLDEEAARQLFGEMGAVAHGDTHPH